MNTIRTLPESSELVWSPNGCKLAYATDNRLKAYITNSATNDEIHLTLGKGKFSHISWSPDGQYLCASRADNAMLIYRFSAKRAHLIHQFQATTVEWLEADRLIYVPENGGLVVVYLGRQTQEFRLAG